MKTLSLIASGIAVGVVVAASSAVYTVGEVEQAIITQFGKPVGAPITEAGLKLNLPFVQEVNRIDSRVLEWDGSSSFGRLASWQHDDARQDPARVFGFYFENESVSNEG